MSDPIRSAKGKIALSYSWTYGPVLETFFDQLSNEKKLTVSIQ